MANPTKVESNGERVEVIDLDVLDKRLTDKRIEWYCEWLKGGDPDRRILVDEDTPLDSFLESVKSLLENKSGKYKCVYKIGVLRILSHGIGHCEYKSKEAYTAAMAAKQCDAKQVGFKKLHPGFGIEFCRDDIDLNTVDKFKSLNGLFSTQDAVGIELRGCGAAYEDSFHIYPNSTEKDQGFGKTLCKKLAKVTGTCVKASEAIQTATVFDDKSGRPIYTYRWGSDIRTVYSCAKFEELTGQVWVFKPDAKEEKLSPVQGK